MTAIAACLFTAVPARAQVGKARALPAGNTRADRPGVPEGHRHIPTTIAAFQPLLKAALKDGVTILRDQAYGEDPREVLDVYRPTARTGAAW